MSIFACRVLVACAVASVGVPALADDAKPEKARTEAGGLPLAGGDTDNGFGLGAMGSIARVDPNVTPYVWKIEFSAFMATKGSLLDPNYQDAYVLMSFPHLLDRHLRLDIRPSYTKETSLRYFGLGNKAPDPARISPDRDYYTRVHPSLSVNATWKISRPWYVLTGVQYTYDQISFDDASTLAREMRSSDPQMREMLDIDPGHSVLRMQAALIYDTRDNEVSPYNGQYHQLNVRESPRIGDAMPYAYQQIDAQARFYYTPVPRRLTLAARGVVDVQFGDPPFYELSRYEETSAIGGPLGVRGVPSYRFYGKVKVFGNLEARSEVLHLKVSGKPYIIGVAAFFDAGRLWADLEHNTALDGDGLGLHYGVGGGLRLQQGKTYVVRADVAWSPDARPIGLYLVSNQIF